MTNYNAALKRIKKASSPTDLARLENSLMIIHSTGLLTDREFMRLDGCIVNKLIRLEV
jgi:hypothetical protein